MSENYQEIKIDELLYKPNSDFIITEILGLEFISINKSPNVYVVKTKDNIKSNFLKFSYKDVKYTLDNVLVHHNGDNSFLECKYWQEEY